MELSWISDLRRVLGEQPCVLVTLNLVSGSAPRESGSRMIVTADETLGSIGGGNLEHQAMQLARELLVSRPDGYQEHALVGLGPTLNQCCGGAVALLYEVFRRERLHWLDELSAALDTAETVVLVSAVDGAVSTKEVATSLKGSGISLPQEVLDAVPALLQDSQKRPLQALAEIQVGGHSWWLEPVQDELKPVYLFGAGHVGQAVARALAPLPFRVIWVDSREDVFPCELPPNIQPVRTETPASLVADAMAASHFIVMTHSHELDEDICYEVLRRDDFCSLGLIGSETKRRRFVHRLEQRGIEPDKLDALICPVGLCSIRGKQPATIALSLAAQLMTHTKD